MTGELVFPVTVGSLGATLVLVIAVFTVTVVMLQKDKDNLRRLVESVTTQTSSGIIVKSKIMKTLNFVIRRQPQKLWTLKSKRILHILLLKICKL